MEFKAEPITIKHTLLGAVENRLALWPQTVVAGLDPAIHPP
jgi:hypothetical protein